MGITGMFSELADDGNPSGESDLQSWGLVQMGPAAAGAPGGFGEGRDAQVDRTVPRLVIWSIWASLSRAPARLTFRPSASPNHRLVSASVMRSSRLSRIWAQAAAFAGVGPQQRAS